MKADINQNITDKNFELDLAWQVWRQEIQIYWQRTLYFSGFISLVGAGYLKVKTLPDAQPELSLLFGMLITFLAFCWYLSNRGSKFWQENWELHIKELETQKIPLMSNVLKKNHSMKRILSSYPFSPYKTNTLISFVVLLMGCFCVLYETLSLFGLNFNTGKWAVLLVIPFALFMILIPKILRFKTFK